jgi:hypothetical protein
VLLVIQNIYLNYGAKMIMVLISFFLFSTGFLLLPFSSLNAYVGSCVHMATYNSREEADRMCDVFEKRGHRQVYWVEKKDEVADGTQRRFR